MSLSSGRRLFFFFSLLSLLSPSVLQPHSQRHWQQQPPGYPAQSVVPFSPILDLPGSLFSHTVQWLSLYRSHPLSFLQHGLAQLELLCTFVPPSFHSRSLSSLASHPPLPFPRNSTRAATLTRPRWRPPWTQWLPAGSRSTACPPLSATSATWIAAWMTSTGGGLSGRFFRGRFGDAAIDSI